MMNKEKRPLVSVVLPVYNGEKYLRLSLESILNQTFTDFELIAVDDGSVDQTPEILEEFRKRDSRVRIIKNSKNEGLPGSLNIGFFVLIYPTGQIVLGSRKKIIDQNRAKGIFANHY